MNELATANADVGGVAQEEKKEDDAAVESELQTAVVAAASNKIEANANNLSNPKTPPLKKPSYYTDSFNEHFFPHAYDANVDESTAPPPPRKKLSQFPSAMPPQWLVDRGLIYPLPSS